MRRFGRRGDPGFFKDIIKGVAKIAAPITKIVSTVSKIPVVGPILSKVGVKAIPVVGQLVTVAQIGSMVGGTVGKVAGRIAAGGSKITKGPLMLGGKNLLPSRPGIGAVAAGAGALGALGIGAGIALQPSHRRAGQTAAAPKRKRGGKKATATKSRKCCPAGTKRMVCFKRGRTKKAKGKVKRASKGVSAAQKRARAKFAAAAKRGPIKKGAKL
jgi:hypothetical protein